MSTLNSSCSSTSNICSANTNKILTVPPNCGFQIRKQVKTTAEQEQALREELHAEIENKTKACSNVAYDCTLPRVEGHEFCMKHILQDPNSPYKQCAFLYTVNGKRCTQPAPKYDPNKEIYTNYCFEHSRQTQLNKTRTVIGKFKNVETNESLLNNLSHHINIEKLDKSLNKDNQRNSNHYPHHLHHHHHHHHYHQHSSSHNESEDSDIDVCNPYVDPFTEINCVERNNSGRRILDYASDSSSDNELTTITNTWKGQDMDCSDNESVDSQNEDLLKHAGIYTTEEATLITKEKMKRLQTLYIEQIFRLQHLLKEKRRKYLHNLRFERENLCSIHDQAKSTFDERKLYEKLKALNKYHKKNGIEAILHRKFMEKRLKVTEGVQPQRTSFHNKCIFTEGGVKCGERIVPCLKYCRKHVLDDKKQILFKPCGIEKGDVLCQEPVACIFDDSTCVLHIEMPQQNVYAQKKYESETEEDDITTNTTPATTTPLSSSVASPIITTIIKNEDIQDNLTLIEENVKDNKNNIINELYSTTTTTTSAMTIIDDKNGQNITICHDDDDNNNLEIAK